MAIYCYIEPGNVSESLHVHTQLQSQLACTSAPFTGTTVGDTLSPDVQDTAVSQECRGVFCYQETSTFPSWKFEHHLIFMHSQHILQPISLFKTNSPSPPWDQPDRSSLLPELEKPGQPAFFLHAALSPSFPLLPHNRPDADG